MSDASQVRAGATILFDSDPDEEEAETRLKASAFLDALSQPRGNPAKLVAKVKNHALSIRVLLVDHEVRPTQNLPNHFCPLTILTLLALCNTP